MARSRSSLLLAVALALVIVMGSVGFRSYQLVGAAFPGFLVWDNGTLVALARDDWTGLRADLPLNGGRIVRVDGEPFRGARALLRDAARAGVGVPLRYAVLSDGELREYGVETMEFGRVDYFATLGNYLGNAAVLFLIGLIALYLRADRVEARALALATIQLGLLLTLSVDFFSTYLFVPILPVVEAATPVTVLHFALVFPVERAGRLRQRALVGAAAALCLGLGVARALLFHSNPETARTLLSIIYVLTSAAGLGMLASFAQATLRAASPVERLRGAVVLAGALASFLFPAIGLLTFALLGAKISTGWIIAPFFVFPLFVLFAVVRYDLLEAERVLRLTVGYAAATIGIVGVYAFILTGLQWIASPDALRGPGTSFLLLLLVAVLFDPLRRRAQIGVDRVFFRSTVDAASVLEGTGVDLAEISDAEEVAAFVGRRLTEALALEWAALDLEEGEARPDAALVEPVLFREDRLGIISCGAKQSGAPFSAAERDLVRGLAAQSALALRNARSIRELAETQESVLHIERLAAIGTFAGAVAHGIRNPLSGIRASAQLARARAQNADVNESLETVIRESDRLEQRIRNLLDFSKPFDTRPRATDLQALLRAVGEAFGPLAERQSVEVRVASSEGLPVLHTDPDYLEEVLLELAGNAFKAMPGGGCLDLRAGYEAGRFIVEIEDTGCGIREAVRERIFDLFFTTRADGTGMGLATVKKVVERLGGSITLAATGASGTRFRIEL